MMSAIFSYGPTGSLLNKLQDVLGTGTTQLLIN